MSAEHGSSDATFSLVGQHRKSHKFYQVRQVGSKCHTQEHFSGQNAKSTGFMSSEVNKHQGVTVFCSFEWATFPFLIYLVGFLLKIRHLNKQSPLPVFAHLRGTPSLFNGLLSLEISLDEGLTYIQIFSGHLSCLDCVWGIWVCLLYWLLLRVLIS